jgi:RNA polymerase sigma factor (sigma-70 family)
MEALARHVLRREPDPELVESLLDRVWDRLQVTVAEELERLQDRVAFLHFVYAHARVVLRTQQRHEVRLQDAELPARQDERAEDPAAALIQKARMATMMRALECLTPLQRSCVQLRHNDLTYAEIQAILGIPAPWARKLVERARFQLGRCVPELQELPDTEATRCRYCPHRKER